MPAKAFVRTFEGQPAIMSTMEGTGGVMVSVYGQDLRFVMSEADWEKLPLWNGPLPFGFGLAEDQ